METMMTCLKRIVMCCFVLVIVDIVFAQDCQVIHQVKRGETLESIAKQYGLTEWMIKNANPQIGDLFYVGLKLNIPKRTEVNTPEKDKVNVEPQKDIVVSKEDKVELQSQLSDMDNSYVSATENDTDIETYDDFSEIGGIGIGYWSYDGGENYGLQWSYLKYNGWAMEWNIRWMFKRYGNCNVDFALLGHSFGLNRSKNSAVFLAVVAGPSLRYQNIYDIESGKDKDKYFIDAYVAASLHFQLSKNFFIKGGYQFLAPKFKFGKDYRADGIYVSIGYCG